MQSIEIDKQPAVLTRPAGLVRSVYSVQCVLQYVHTVYSILYVEEVLSPRPITIMMIVCSVLRTASPLPFILYKLTRGPFRTESRDHHRRTACRSDPGVCISLLFVLVTVPADFNVQYLVINSGPSRKASWWCADISWYVMIVYCILVILVNHGLLAVMHSQLLYTYQLMILYTDYIQYYVLSLHYISVVQEMIWSRSPWRPTASTNKNPPGGPRVASFNPTDACPSGLPFERHSIWWNNVPAWPWIERPWKLIRRGCPLPFAISNLAFHIHSQTQEGLKSAPRQWQLFSRGLTCWVGRDRHKNHFTPWAQAMRPSASLPLRQLRHGRRGHSVLYILNLVAARFTA